VAHKTANSGTKTLPFAEVKSCQIRNQNLAKTGSHGYNKDMKQPYLPRISDKILEKALKSTGAVLIEGPKWCGKTRTAEEKAASVLYMQDPDHTASYLQAADIKPSL